MLQEFVSVEMAFHAKALETLTLCHKSLSIMNEEEDLEVCDYVLLVNCPNLDFSLSEIIFPVVFSSQSS